MDVGAIYRFLIGAIVPRPIALITSVSPEGIVNLAPFSFFCGVSSAPPCLAVSISEKPGGKQKDTLNNILSAKEFCVNAVTEANFKSAHQSSAEYPPDQSEIEPSGFETLPSQWIKAPRIRQSPIQMECKLYQSVPIGKGGIGSSTLIIGEIVMAYVDPAILVNGNIDVNLLKPVSRLGGPFYGMTPDSLAMPKAIP